MPVIPIALGVMAATAVGTSIYQATQKPPSLPTPDPNKTAEQQARASQAAALAQAQALTKRRGMASTILTSPLGTTGTPSVGKATLGA